MAKDRREATGKIRPCPCGLGLPYDECCGPLHGGQAAASAEALMRSRFSAFALGDAAYLLRSWHSTTRPARLLLDPRQRWTRLEVLGTEAGGLLDSTGVVEFRAHYREPGETGSVHERSRFVREHGHWVYLDGELS
ncbi:YchJ family protein [Melissospora conviva]|uniref:YchJ family protein n=1 Tax=Melissospora conviva TaxID=3388432 RepID=UPI003B794A56